MKYSAFCFAAGLFLLLGAGCAGLDQAQSQSPGVLAGNHSADTAGLPEARAPRQVMKDGQIKIMAKSGDVQLLFADGSKQSVKKGDIFGDGTVVVAGPDGHVLLAFSNGALMILSPNSQLEIKRFKQAPFDANAAGGTFVELSKDPSRSETELNLINGTLQGEIKHLDEAAGSKFNVDTPGGSVGIRGTVISLSVVRDDTTGQVTAITANCFVGAMTFTPYGGRASNVPGAPNTLSPADAPVAGVTGESLLVPAGSQIQETLSVDANGRILAVNVGGTSLSPKTSEAALNTIFESINTGREDPMVNLVPLAPLPVSPAPPPATVERARPLPPPVGPQPPPVPVYLVPK